MWLLFGMLMAVHQSLAKPPTQQKECMAPRWAAMDNRPQHQTTECSPDTARGEQPMTFLKVVELWQPSVLLQQCQPAFAAALSRHQ